MSAGKIVDQNKKAQSVLCGLYSNGVEDSACKDKMEKGYKRGTDDLTSTEKTIFDDSYNLIYGNRYDACFIDRGDGTPIYSLDADADADAHKACAVKFVADDAKVAFEGQKLTYTDAVTYLRARAIRRVEIATSMIAIPTNLKAYLDGIRGDHKEIADEGARLFYDALQLVEPMKQFEAAIPVGEGVIVKITLLLLNDALSADEKKIEMFKSYVFSVNEKFEPTILTLPDATVDKAKLGVADKVDEYLVQVIRHLFVDALRVYRRVGGADEALKADRDVNLEALGEKLAVAVKAEGKEKGMELLVHLSRKVVKSVGVDSATKPISVTLADATLSVPRKLLSGIGHRTPIMTSAMKFIWDQVTKKEPKAKEAGKFQDKVMDSLTTQLKDKGPYEIVLNRVISVDGESGAVVLEPISTEVIGGKTLSQLSFANMDAELVMALYRNNAGEYLKEVGDGDASEKVAKEIGDKTRASFDAHEGQPEMAAAEIFGSSTGGGGKLPSWLMANIEAFAGYMGLDNGSDGPVWQADVSLGAKHSWGGDKTEYTFGGEIGLSSGSGVDNGATIGRTPTSVAITNSGEAGSHASVVGPNIFFGVKHKISDDWTLGSKTVAGVARMPSLVAGVDGLHGGSKMLLSEQLTFTMGNVFRTSFLGMVGTSTCSPFAYDGSYVNDDGSKGKSKALCEGADAAGSFSLAFNPLALAGKKDLSLWIGLAGFIGGGVGGNDKYQQSVKALEPSFKFGSKDYGFGGSYTFNKKSYGVDDTTRHTIGANVYLGFLKKSGADYNRLKFDLGFMHDRSKGEVQLIDGSGSTSSGVTSGLVGIDGDTGGGLTDTRLTFPTGYIANSGSLKISWSFMEGISIYLKDELSYIKPHEGPKSTLANIIYGGISIGIGN